MNRFWVIIPALLVSAVWIAESWAHGSAGPRGGIRRPGYFQPRFVPPVYPQPSYRYHPQKKNYRPQAQPQVLPRRYPVPKYRRFPKTGSGGRFNRPGLLQNRPFNSPLARAYEQGVGVSPLKKARKRQAAQSPRPHTHAPPPWFLTPDPWFLYGHDYLPR